MALKRAVWVENQLVEQKPKITSLTSRDFLAAKAVERAALTLERVHDVHRCDRLALRVLSVRDGVADDVLEEHLRTQNLVVIFKNISLQVIHNV